MSQTSIHLAKSNLIRIKNIALMFDATQGILIHIIRLSLEVWKVLATHSCLMACIACFFMEHSVQINS